MRGSLERLSPALVSGDMTSRPGVCDADMIAALGFAGRVYPMASPLIRMYLAGDNTSVHEARRLAYDMAKKAAARQNMNMCTAELVKVGRTALAYAANKACPRCSGTKYEVISGTNRLGAEPCRECGGDGRRRLPRRNRRLIAAVVAQIERVESNLDAIVGRRVGR